ncbi:inhibitor of cysteine peptidase [Paraburkholderia atlantica]|uniref:protease inhibitor I42 family protein n=1 Tax=Paraburkholderia atlantica TaxID=2654982 RepID=UPI003D25DAE6
MPAVTLTEANNGQVIAIRRGDVIDLQLHENPTTGFRWQVVRSDGLIEEPAADHERPPRAPEQNPQFGAGGIRTLRFRARAPGTGRLELKLWREFEGESSVVKRFASDITITD